MIFGENVQIEEPGGLFLFHELLQEKDGQISMFGRYDFNFLGYELKTDRVLPCHFESYELFLRNENNDFFFLGSTLITFIGLVAMTPR